ncbi:hypothetical protein V8B97DRAFT_117504 [Scleroderma yunnanense]
MSSKRILTDEEHTIRSASGFQRRDDLPSDYTASIRNASMRARKMVMEGYRGPPSSSNAQQYSSPVKESTPSANEVLRQVFPSSGGYIPLPSPSKRRHKVEPDDENLGALPVDGMSDQDEIMDDMSGGETMEVERPIKPLRRSMRSKKMESSPLTPHYLPKSPELSDINSIQELGIAVSESHTQDAVLELPEITPNTPSQ